MSDSKEPEETSKKPLTNRQTYNLVTDTVIGPNVRLKDNLYQGLAILVSLIVGLPIGYLIFEDPLLGALAGGFFGLLVGLFGSGIYLMIYRGIRHIRSKHD